jgi:2-oxoisovalerate dehydrogenase E2 component (dihydrolipoyl transacylase)
MSTTIVMPQLGESVAEGVIGKWLKNEGDAIEKDEPIVEVITDKVNAEIPSPVAGVLEKITQPEGATVAVGQEIAIIGGGDGRRSETEVAAAPAPASSGNGQQAPAPAGSAQAPSDGAGGRAERVRSSPLVRRLAEQHGVNLAQVSGTGIGGRVSKQDILAFVEQRQQAGVATLERPETAVETVERPAPETVLPPTQAPPAAVQQPPARPPQPAPVREAGDREELIPISPLRKMIADRMVQSVYTIPHAMTMSEVDVTPVVRYRESRKDAFREQEGVSLSYVGFVIKAVVEALKEYPLVNAEWGGDHIIRKRDININVAVDAPEGLITPVIHHADDRSLAGLSRAIYDLATRARGKKLKVEDMQGGTFTVNNTGALGSTGGFSIINYPQAGILSHGLIVKRPVVVEQDGQDLITVRSMMNLSFSFDHRLLDGGYAAGFVESVKRILEHWPQDYPLY